MSKRKITTDQLLAMIDDSIIHLSIKVMLANVFIEYLDRLITALTNSDVEALTDDMKERIVEELEVTSHKNRFWFQVGLNASPKIYPDGFPVPPPTKGEEIELFKKQYQEYFEKLDVLRDIAKKKGLAYDDQTNKEKVVLVIAYSHVENYQQTFKGFDVSVGYADFSEFYQWISEFYELPRTITFLDVISSTLDKRS